MKDISQMTTLESVFGFVGTAAPGWHDQYDLRYAVDPQARMQMQLIDYREVRSGYDRRRYIAQKLGEWGEVVKYAPIKVVSLDEPVPPPPDRWRAREAILRLLTHTIVGDWYVAGLIVCEENGLNILIGHIRDHRDLEAPADAYAVVNISCPPRELHLRLKPSNPHIVGSGRPLFYDVHLTAKGQSHNHEEIRVREFFFPKSRRPGCYDVRDWEFQGQEGAYVPTNRYRDVRAWPVLDPND